VYAPAATDLCTCPSDLDGDRSVGSADLGLALLEFGLCPGSAADLNHNGLCDSSDLGVILLDFGACP